MTERMQAAIVIDPDVWGTVIVAAECAGMDIDAWIERTLRSAAFEAYVDSRNVIDEAVEASKAADRLGLRMTSDADPARETIARQARVHAELCEFIRDPTSEELGDILLATIRLGLRYGIQPEGALREAVTKFRRRLSLLPENPTIEDWQRAKTEDQAP
jgi:uncharacterized protein YabN with tetrapyrrole methylase and pyrophosphatase domain